MSQRIGRKKRKSAVQAEDTAQPAAEGAETTVEPGGGYLHQPLVHVLLLLLVGLAIYGSVLGAPFVFDDHGCIQGNPAITDFRYIAHQALLKKLPLDEDLYRNIVLRPVAYATFALNYSLHGFDVRGYHVFNLLIHLANALLVYLLVLLFTRTPLFRGKGSDALPLLPPVLVAFFAALFFVSHPLQTQAVSYIAQRFASLATLFYLLSLTLYVQSRLAEKALHRYLFYAGSLLGAVLAMKTKEIAFTLPVMICLCEFMFLRGSAGTRALCLTPFLATMAAIPATVMHLAAETAQGGHSSIGHSLNLVNYGEASKLHYLFTQFRVIVTYLRLLVLPAGQNVDHDYPLYTSFFAPPVFLSFVFLLVLLGGGIYLYRLSARTGTPRRHWLRLVAFGIFWFFVTLSVESSIIPIDDLMVEHRAYLPSVGFFLACMAAVASLGSRVRANHAVIALSLLAAVLAATAAARNTVWRDPIALWKDAATKSPHKSRPFANLGVHYFERGQLAEGLEALTTSLRIDPDNLEARHNVANIYLELNRYDEAEREYRSLIRLQPDNEKVHNNLGRLLHLKKEYDGALLEYRRAVEINPYFPNARINMAELYEELGQRDNAAREYEAALKLSPADTFVRDRLEKVLGR